MAQRVLAGHAVSTRFMMSFIIMIGDLMIPPQGELGVKAYGRVLTEQGAYSGEWMEGWLFNHEKW